MAERRRRKTRLFTGDVKALLYAFGDVEEPNYETVNVLEDVLINYLIDTCHDAAAFAKTTHRQKIKVDDFKFALRKDPMKHGRIQELLALQKIITDAKKQFDNSEGKSVKAAGQGHHDEDDEDEEDDGEHPGGGSAGGNTNNSNNAAGSATGSSTASVPAAGALPGAKQQPVKYNKDGSIRKARKPYKKRAKKGEAASSASQTPA